MRETTTVSGRVTKPTREALEREAVRRDITLSALIASLLTHAAKRYGKAQTDERTIECKP